MTKATFEADISAIINRGTRYDSYIEGYTARAIAFLERNYSFKYMERFCEFTVSAGSNEPEVLPYPSRLKEMSFMRFIKDDGEYHYIKQGDPQQFAFSPTNVDLADLPTHYHIDADQRIWLNKRVTEDQSGELMYYQFTDWSDVESGDTHWLLDHAEDVLFAHTIIQMGPLLRMPDLMSIYREMLPELMKSLAIAQEANKQADRVEQAEYGRDYSSTNYTADA